jgi:Rap1a immunity proteins
MPPFPTSSPPRDRIVFEAFLKPASACASAVTVLALAPANSGFIFISNCFYVVGVVDAFVDKPGVLCVPQDKVQVGDLVAIVSSSLNDHPTDRNRPAADLVIGTLKEKFPCN